MAIRKNKTPTRSRKQAEFKVLGEASYGNPERLGRALMRCIEYLELVGYGATMTGGEENRTCMDILLKGMRRRGKRHGVPVVITVKPSMYNGMNESIRALLADPHAGIEGKYDFDIPEGETVNNLLHGGKTYYDILEEYGYRITAMEALIEFFLKNQNAEGGSEERE